MRRRRAIPMFVIALGCLSTSIPETSRAAGTVGTGSAASCTEAALDAALGGGGVVIFDCGGPALIVFTATKTILADTTINGSPGIVLSGGGSVRLFTASGGSLALSMLSLINGHDTVANPGGAAISGSHDVTVSDSTLSGHVATNGGCPAISVTDATLRIFRSTITTSNNAAATNSSAVCINNTATLIVANATISGNNSGAIFASGTATITNSTIAGNTGPPGGNTGGVLSFGSGAVTLNNTIVANNAGSGGAGQCSAAAGGTITDGGGNLQFPDALCGATIPVADPLLGTLADNGGPTQTMALQPGSPAIDRGVALNCTLFDQRGVLPQDGDGNGSVVCDSGAYEAPRLIRPTSVPTSGTTLLGLLALLLTGLAARQLRQRSR